MSATYTIAIYIVTVHGFGSADPYYNVYQGPNLEQAFAHVQTCVGMAWVLKRGVHVALFKLGEEKHMLQVEVKPQ